MGYTVLCGKKLPDTEEVQTEVTEFVVGIQASGRCLC